MALSQAKLQKKREKANAKRKGKRYRPHRYYTVVKGVAVEQSEPIYNADKETLTL